MKTDLLSALTEIENIICLRGFTIPGIQSKAHHFSATELAESCGREGLKDSWELRYKRGWGVGCSLRISLKPIDNPFHKREEETREVWEMVQEYSWSASSYNLAAAISQAALLREVTELGAILQTLWDQYRVQK
jgi:hypothetical protein